MDLSEINVPETAEIHIEHPTIGKLYADDDRKKPMVIEVFGPASDEAVKQRRKATRNAQQLIAKRGVKGLASRSPEDSEEDDIQRLIALTSSVKNLKYKGKVVDLNSIEDLYRDPKMGWIVDQVKEKLSGWEDFLA